MSRHEFRTVAVHMPPVIAATVPDIQAIGHMRAGRWVIIPVAADIPAGTPHPDPFLSVKGWQQGRHGIWERITP